MKKENILLKINNLSFSYDDKSIIEDFSMLLHEGEILGLAGENGSGKSTLLKLVAGYVKGYSGEIIFPCDEVKSNMAAVIDIPYIYEDMKTEDNLVMMSTLHGVSYDKNLVEILGLCRYMKKKASALSFGNRQKLAICMAVNEKTRLALLDEPFNGLDVLSKVTLTDYISSRAKNGMGVVITSHIKGDLERLCDKIIEMG